jgi:hypothetical protein
MGQRGQLTHTWVHHLEEQFYQLREVVLLSRYSSYSIKKVLVLWKPFLCYKHRAVSPGSKTYIIIFINITCIVTLYSSDLQTGETVSDTLFKQRLLITYEEWMSWSSSKETSGLGWNPDFLSSISTWTFSRQPFENYPTLWYCFTLELYICFQKSFLILDLKTLI